jgi:proteasome lid subunit RPN8/RPN11
VTPPAWRVPGSVLDGMTAHARRAYPEECCGLLLGRDDCVAAYCEAANTSLAPTRRYTIDPGDHFAAIRHARSLDLEVVGAYHSHPRSPAVPSPADLAEAFPQFLFAIVSLAGPVPEVTGWLLVDGNFVQTRLVRTA